MISLSQNNSYLPAILLLQKLTPKDRPVPLHWHHSLELDFIDQGHINLNLRKKQYTLVTGHLFLINYRELHNIVPLQITNISRLLISANFIEKCLPDFANLRFDITQDGFDQSQLLTHMRNIKKLYQNNDVRTQLLIYSELYQILHQLVTTAVIPAPLETNYSDIASILELIRKNYDSQLNVSKIASTFNLENRQFEQFFQAQVGLSFQQYLLNLRLDHAQQQLIHSDLKIIDIAFNNGFESAGNFIKAFQSIYRLTPAQYRRQLARY